MIERACPICGAAATSKPLFAARLDPARLNEFSYASRKSPELMHHALRLCDACDLVYASPAPAPETLAELYRDAAFDSARESRYAARAYRQRLDEMTPRSSLPPGAALDVGAGDGAFLEELLRSGWAEVYGLEPSSAPLRSASAEVRARIQQTSFTRAAVAPRPYALITAFQTMSHAPDPSEIATTAFEALEPGGAFFVIEHDRRAPLNRLLGRKSPIYDVEHLQLFDERSLGALFAKSGFSRLSARPLVNTYPLSYWIRLAPLPARAKSAILRSRALSRALDVEVSLAAGNIAFVGFKPVRA